MSFFKLLTAGILICSLPIGQTSAQTEPPSEHVGIGEPAGEPPPSSTGVNLCSRTDDQSDLAEYADFCRDWSLLLGEWTNPVYGGTIEFKLLPDKTVSAYISKVSERMLNQGYRRNMQIARGWEFGGTDAGTWKFFARNGEVLSAKIPNRDAGSIFGTEVWVQAGIIHIHRDRPGVVNLPAQLEGRISDYKDWVRVDTTVSSTPGRPTIPEFCPVISNPVCGIRNGKPKMFNNVCEVENNGFRPVHIARCQTSNDPAPNSPTFNFQCTHVSKPACAVDLEGIKRTFSNVCEARKENHSVLYEGECKPTPILGSDANSMMCPTVSKPVCAE